MTMESILAHNVIGEHGRFITRKERRKPPVPSALVPLSCGCERTFTKPAPQPGDSLYCAYCDKTVWVVTDDDE